MTINLSTDVCFACSKNIPITDSNYQFSICGHIFHTHCWKGKCTPCAERKELREKQISEENWAAVKFTAILSITMYALMRLRY